MCTQTNPFIRSDRYTRCWEINSSHLPVSAIRYLQHLADARIQKGLMFEAFRTFGHDSVGCRLEYTPWAGSSFESLFSETPQTLRQLQLGAGAPEVLVDLLHLAGEVDTSILIFDARAPELDGLPTYR